MIMITEIKQRLLIWSVVVLLVLNVATLSTIGFHMWKSRHGASFNMGEHPMNGEAVEFCGRLIKDKLNLSDDQLVKFREINPKFRDEVRSTKQVLADFRTQMMDEMKSEKPDTLKLNAIATKIGETHKQLKISTYNYYFNLKQMCNPSQKAILDSIFAENMLSDASVRMGRFGKGCGAQTGQGIGRHQGLGNGKGCGNGQGFGNGNGQGNGNGRGCGNGSDCGNGSGKHLGKCPQ